MLRMNEDKKRIFFSVAKSIHFLVCVALFFYAWIYYRYGKYEIYDVGYRYNYYMTIAYAFFLLSFGATYNIYLLGYCRIRTLVFSQFLTQLFSVFFVWAGSCVAWRNYRSPKWFFVLVAIDIIWDVVWSYFLTIIYFNLYQPRKALLIYRNKVDRYRLGDIEGRAVGRLYRIEKEIQYDGEFEDIADKLDGYEIVFVAGVNSNCRNGILKYCKENGIQGYFLPHIGDVIMQGAKHIQAFDSPVLFVEKKTLDPIYVMAKRAFDILVSLVGIIVLSPIMLIVALCIKFYDGGDVLYKQTRLTKDGKTFKILKFRSMRMDAEKDGVARLSTGEEDDRITPIGKVIRKFRLDELPQLFNIFWGDMTIVGPRPERPEIAEKYYATLSDFKLRLDVKAGLTGYAQIYGKYNTNPYEKLEFDLLYINEMSILTDLRLMFATVSILFSSESTKGVTGTTAIDEEKQI